MVDPQRTGARDECGVVAVHAPGEPAAKLTYYALFALQHRGQEAAGIAVVDGDELVVSKEVGLVSQVFDESRLSALPGQAAIGHVRYSTQGGSTWANAQPTFKVRSDGTSFSLGHNGQLVNTDELAEVAGPAAQGCGSDSQLIAELLAGTAHHDLESALLEVCPMLRGAYSMVAMEPGAVHGVRDPHGVRPLVVGRLPGGGWVLASETAGIDILGAEQVGEVEPGELVTIDADGLRRRRWAEATPHFCSFEYVYLARPDHRTAETSVYAARRRMGLRLAEEAPADADLVIPVPDSGLAAASGYAQGAGIPHSEGLVKNRYVGRTFIEPSQSLRERGIRLKLSPLQDVLDGQRVVVVDDSIVRGNTSRQLVGMLRQAGATEVHLRITSPPVRNPCYYGIDMATRRELVASGLEVDEVRDYLGADSLAHLSLQGLIEATGRPADRLCTACFSGRYPIPVPGESTLRQQSLPLLGGPAPTDGEEGRAPARVR